MKKNPHETNKTFDLFHLEKLNDVNTTFYNFTVICSDINHVCIVLNGNRI